MEEAAPNMDAPGVTGKTQSYEPAGQTPRMQQEIQHDAISDLWQQMLGGALREISHMQC